MSSFAPLPAFSNRYTRLPQRFYEPAAATPAVRPRIVLWNAGLAAELGIPAGVDPDAIAPYFSGNSVPPRATPIATAYAGHQFGHFVPRLGDGRAILLGELADSEGAWQEIQLKGAGRTAFSRGGDGRCALGPAIREFLACEAMHALGIPTTRALAVTLTGERVYRESALPGAVVTRVAPSHVRVGTFQYFASRNDDEGVKLLADRVIADLYPEAASAANPYRALFLAVRGRQAALIAQWMSVGFLHGVMNTDNMSVAGITIDYGPCAFLDAYHPLQVFSSIDQQGRYAFSNQPRIAAWNLARFAETLLPLLGEDQEQAVAWAQQAVHGFFPEFEAAWHSRLAAKLGLTAVEEGDPELAASLLDAMAEAKADFTLTFRALAGVLDSGGTGEARLLAQFPEPSRIRDWIAAWCQRLARQPENPEAVAAAMRAANPAVILRNHRVEQAINAATDHEDYGPALALHAALARPFDPAHDSSPLAEAPGPDAWLGRTFCGT